MTYPCVLCSCQLTPTEIQCCAACVADVRRDLVAIEAGFALLPGLLGQPAAVGLGTVMGIGSEAAAIPDALVMLGPGAYSHEGDFSDPPAVAFELWSWAGDWCEIRREDPARVPGDVPGLVAFLGARLGWGMSHHPAAGEFAADVARISSRLAVTTGTLNAPERGAACPYCRVALQRVYGDWGRPDDWSCPRCRRGFDERQYTVALRGELAELAHSHPTYRSMRSESSACASDGDPSRRRQQMITHSCRAGEWPCGEHREGARWSGNNNGHCSGCGELFIGERAFDRHITHDSAGKAVCVDVETAVRKDGDQMFERVDKPKWEPPYAWRMRIPNRTSWTGPAA